MNDHIKNRQPILIVEDCDYDYKILIKAMQKADILAVPIHRFVTGEGALDYLFREGAYLDLPAPIRPALVLLDLNLPGLDGQHVLVEIKNNVKFKSVPVIIISTSDDESEIAECYTLGANSYIQKSMEYARFKDRIMQLREYLIDVAIRPSG